MNKEEHTLRTIVFKDLEKISQRKKQKIVYIADKKKEVELNGILDIIDFFGDKS